MGVQNAEFRNCYVVTGKKFFIADLDMHRVAIKKANRRAQKLDPHKRDVFMRIVNALEKVVVWEMLNQHVFDSINQNKPLSNRGNIYALQEGINKTLKLIEKWVRRNEDFTDSKVREFAVVVHQASKSICRVFDQNATCWEKDAAKLVTEYVRT